MKRLIFTHPKQNLFQKIGTLVSVTTLFTSQSLWQLNQPVLADKVDTNSAAICALPGLDGNVIVQTTQVNTYYTGVGSNVSAGSTSITVGSITRGATDPIKAGDLLLLIQMQGADINTSNTDAYGDGDSGNNAPPNNSSNYPSSGVANGNLNNSNFTAGNFEYVVAKNVSGNTITLSTPLVNSYSNANADSTHGQRRFQVIRVPQYGNLTINSTGKIEAAPWDGQSGGIVAVDVAGTLDFKNGEINVAGKGFRGGGGRRLQGDGNSPLLSNTDIVTSSTRNANASKGEGTAGTPRYLVKYGTTASLVDTLVEGYPDGSYGRGAPGNAGGGGTDGNPSKNDQNSGGGGGSNGGLGGKGGRTWFSARPYGGDGGAPFPSSARRLVMGGGAGAGTNNDGTGSPGSGLASSGAPGGGIVIVRATNIAGTGTINASGATPTLTQIPGKDASGGGGAGGSVLVISQNSAGAAITVNAKGGQGGTNTGGGSPHGPGGGGGGGVIYASPSLLSSSDVSGGQPGTTDNKATEFGGATAGNGLLGPYSASPTDAVTSISGANCLIKVEKTTSTPGPLAAGTTATYTIKVSNPSGTNRPEAREVVITDDSLPSGFTHTPVAITPEYAGGATGPGSVTATGTNSRPSWEKFTIPPGGSVSLTFTVNINDTTTPGTYNNSATATAKYVNPSAGVTDIPNNAVAVSTTYNGNINTNTQEDVKIAAPSSLVANKTVAVVEDNDKSGGTTPLAKQVATPGDTLEYTIVVTNTSTQTPATGVVLRDAIPANTTYVPDTLQISSGENSGDKSDASSDDQAEFNDTQVIFRLGTGANGSTGGTLGTTATDKSTTIKFRVKIKDPTPNGVTTVSNQAVISMSGFPDTNSNDPNTTAVNDPTVTKIGPRLRLVKRVTGIRKDASNTTIPVGGYNDLATDVNDNSPVSWPSGWSGGINYYLQGAITTEQIPANPGAPGSKDEIEYTIYFLSDGAMAAQDVNICDFIPANQTYVPGTMQMSLNGAEPPTDVPDGSGTFPDSGFYPPQTNSFPAACSGTNNNRGAAYFRVGNVNSVNANLNPYYGYIRFRAKVGL